MTQDPRCDLQGWPTHISRIHDCAAHNTYIDRLARMGNALNASQSYYILRHFNPNHTVVDGWPVSVEYLTTTELEAHLSNMSHTQLIGWVKQRLKNYKPIPLDLKLKRGQRPHAKPHRGYNTPAGLVQSMQYMLAQQIEKGYMREVPYSSDFFVSQGFVQAKPGIFPWHEHSNVQIAGGLSCPQRSMSGRAAASL